MRRSSLTIKTLSVAVLCGVMCSFSACGGKKEAETTTTVESSTETTPIITTVTTTAETTLQEYGMSIAPNDVSVTWTEEPMEAKVMYVNIAEKYLKIRKGPGTDYDQVGTLTRNMQVVVVAKTDNNWYKLEDGFYVSGDYLSATPV